MTTNVESSFAKSRCATLFLAYLALVWVSYGIALLVSPTILTGLTGIEFTTATAMTEARAMYGGAQIAIGVSALLGILCSAWLKQAVWLQIILTAGLGSTRAIGVLLDGSPDTYTWGALGFEFSTVILGLLAYRRVP